MMERRLSQDFDHDDEDEYGDEPLVDDEDGDFENQIMNGASYGDQINTAEEGVGNGQSTIRGLGMSSDIHGSPSGDVNFTSNGISP